MVRTVHYYLFETALFFVSRIPSAEYLLDEHRSDHSAMIPSDHWIGQILESLTQMFFQFQHHAIFDLQNRFNKPHFTVVKLKNM